MSDADIGMRLEVSIDPDADAVDLEDAALQLRQELLDLDVHDVEQVAGDAPPPDTRAIETALLGMLVVHAGRETISTVIRTIGAWVGRRADRTVKITLDGDSLELTNVSDDDRQRLIESFLARHAAA